MAIGNINPAAAAGAYANTQKASGAAVASGNDKASFGDMVRNVAEKSIETMETGEQASANAVMGTANLTDVVEAVTAAELTLQTVVSVRDRMMSAYQDIMRMPI